MSKKFFKTVASAIAAIAISLSLTACDPPMPPDVAAQILEQTYTCEEGEATIQAPIGMADLTTQWSEALASACVDPLPAMTLANAAAGNAADLLVSTNSAGDATCKPDFTVPFALEAGDVAFQLADSTTLNLLPKTMAAILNGKITNWNDPAIAADNEGTTFPDLPIKLRNTADPLALSAVQGWLKNLKQDISGSAIKPTEGDQVDSLAEGEVAIMPNSRVMELSLYAASIITGTNKETGEQLLALADPQGIASAGSQLKIKKSASALTFTLDPAITPVAQAGFDEAAPPYQAIYPIFLSACGEASTLKHAAALYLLRLDSQGIFGASNYNPLPEQIRFEALAIARKGLPTPSAMPQE